MNNTATIQIRIDSKTKERARKNYAEMGMDLSTVMRVFLTQSAKDKGFPYRMFSYDNVSDTRKRALIREAEYAFKHGKRYENTKEMFDEILGREK